jgi:hypothetical protein
MNEEEIKELEKKTVKPIIETDVYADSKEAQLEADKEIAKKKQQKKKGNSTS